MQTIECRKCMTLTIKHLLALHQALALLYLGIGTDHSLTLTTISSFKGFNLSGGRSENT